jgi:hypothetical protein
MSEEEQIARDYYIDVIGSKYRVSLVSFSEDEIIGEYDTLEEARKAIKDYFARNKMSEDCKYCNNPFPNMAQSLRSSLRTTRHIIMMNMLRCEEDKGFEEIQNAKYCCHAAQYDAEDAYDEYFPYKGMLRIEGSIQDLYNISLYLNEAFGDNKLTAEEFMALDSCDGEIAQYMQDLEFTYKRLNKLCWNVKEALERETDPEKRKLLDGRNK